MIFFTATYINPGVSAFPEKRFSGRPHSPHDNSLHRCRFLNVLRMVLTVVTAIDALKTNIFLLGSFQHFFFSSVPEMTIKIEPGISLDKLKKEAPEKADKESGSPGDARDELVTPEPTGEEGDAVILDGDAQEDDSLVKQADSTIEITRVSGGDEGGSKKEEKVGAKVIKEGSKGRAESKEETSGVVGELFTQLVGEVEKINEGVQKQGDAAGENSGEKEHKMAADAESDDRDEDIDLTISFATAITGAIEDAPKDMEDMEVELEPKSVANPKRSTHSPNSKNGEDRLGEPEKRSNGDGEDEDDESAPSKQSDDWLPEDALEEDIDGEDEYFETNGAAEEEDEVGGGEGGRGADDFGGYDPLKLAQMSESDLNELDFEMDDDGMEVTTEDHEIFDENSESIDGNEDVSNSSGGNRSNKKDELGEEEEDAGLSENVSTDYGMDFADSEGVSLDQEEDIGGMEAPLEEGLQPHGEAAEDTLDDSKEDGGNEEDAFEIDVPKTSSGNDRSYNGDENLNEDCDDDVEEGGEEEDCINDDHLQPVDNAEEDSAEADVLSEDLTSDHVEVGGEEEDGEESHLEGEGYQGEGEENTPGASCDNSA